MPINARGVEFFKIVPITCESAAPQVMKVESSEQDAGLDQPAELVGVVSQRSQSRERRGAARADIRNFRSDEEPLKLPSRGDCEREGVAVRAIQDVERARSVDIFEAAGQFPEIVERIGDQQGTAGRGGGRCARAGKREVLRVLEVGADRPVARCVGVDQVENFAIVLKQSTAGIAIISMAKIAFARERQYVSSTIEAVGDQTGYRVELVGVESVIP